MDIASAHARLEQLLDGAERALAQERTRGLERRIRGLPERAMRHAVLREVLPDLRVPDLVAVLALAVERGRHGRGDSRELLQELALEPTVFMEMSYEQVQAAYTLAKDKTLPGVASMFLGARTANNQTVDEAFVGNEHIDHPVGVRRAWARGGDRFRLDRLLHDRDWRVVHLLLENPRVVERDIVKMAAMRPTRPELLEMIARHRRWASRYPVRMTLALNPYTPSPIVRRLLPTLLRQDLRVAIGAGVLDEEMVVEARRLLASNA